MRDGAYSSDLQSVLIEEDRVFCSIMRLITLVYEKKHGKEYTVEMDIMSLKQPTAKKGL